MVFTRKDREFAASYVSLTEHMRFSLGFFIIYIPLYESGEDLHIAQFHCSKVVSTHGTGIYIPKQNTCYFFWNG